MRGKITFVIFLMAFSISSFAQDGEWSIHSFHGFFEDMEMIDESTGWMLNIGLVEGGFSQELVKTIDGGVSWFKCPVPANDIGGFDFANTNSGWTVHANGSIYYSNNGGKTWSAQTSGTTDKLNAVDFIDANNGWAVGGSGYPTVMEYMGGSGPAALGHILRTANGGSSWNIQPSIVADPLVDVYFKDANEGWAIGVYGSLLHTINGGVDWDTQQLADSLGYGSIFFFGDNNGWIAGYKVDPATMGLVLVFYKTVDGGANWNSVNTGFTGIPISFTFKDTNNGWMEVCDLATGDITLYKTIDGGSSWVDSGISLVTGMGAMAVMEVGKAGAIVFIDSNNGYLIDVNDNYRITTDGGTTWNDDRLSYEQIGGIIITPPANDVFFFDSMNGWACPFNLSGLSNIKMIYKTSDGGLNWSAITTNVGFSSLYFTDLNNGWALSGSDVYQTIDGGSTWTLKSTIVFAMGMGVSAPSEIRGDDRGNLFVRDMISIWRSSDGGTTWVNMILNFDIFGGDLSYSYNSIFVNDSGCWVVGKGGIYIIPNGVLSGYLEMFQPAEKLNDIFFIDDNKGWAVGDNGYIVSTVDGGTTWTSQNSNIADSMIAISFMDANNGWASTGNYFIYTSDGGTTWSQYDFSLPATYENISGMFLGTIEAMGYNFLLNYTMTFPDLYSGWLASPYGLLKYSSFLATQDYLRIVSPNGGENWYAGTSHNITWIRNNVTDVKLEYSTNGGTDWTTIIASTPAAAQSYSWTVPSVASSNVLVRISDVSDPALFDLSDNEFTIKNPFITVLSPNGGEIWSGGSGQTITWNSQDVDFVKIEYSIDNGSNWFDVVASVNASNASYFWITPMVNSANMKIKISSLADPTLFDVSNNVFAISISTLIAIGSVTAYTGMTVEVPINLYLSAYDEIIPYNIQGKITFDPAKLEFKSAFANSGTLLNSFGWTVAAWLEGAGVLKFVCTGITPIDENGILMKLSFRIADIGAGTAELETTRSDWTSNFSNPLVDETMDGSVTYTVLAGDSQIRGDANLDLVVDFNDALAVIYHVINLTPLVGQALVNADADLDEDVDVNDYLEVVMYTVFGYWNAIVLPQSNASVQFNNSQEVQDMSISVPVDVVNTDNVQTLEVQFEYDPTVIQRSELASCMNQNNCYTNLAEVEPGKAVLTFASTSSITNDFTPANVMFIKNIGIVSGGSIITKYRVNDGDLVNGQPIYFGVTGVDDNSLPTDYMLRQNYPNPFNPITTIEFSIPQDGMVNLVVYDNLGREVTRLVNEYKSAGNYSVQFNGNELPSGIYFCRFSSNGHFFVNKMVLLK